MLSLEAKRLSTIISCFIASLGCGTIYVYSAYSTQLADRLDLSATETSLIGMTGPLGVALLGSIAGYLVDHYGMLLPCCLGTICLLVGYATLYHAYVFTIRIVPLLCFALGLAGFGSTLTYAACIKTTALNFPLHRGTATSVPMSAFGLSAFLFSTVGGIAYPGDTSGFLLVLTLLTTSLSFFNIPFIRVYGQPEIVSDGGERQPLIGGQDADTTTGTSSSANYANNSESSSFIVPDDANKPGANTFSHTATSVTTDSTVTEDSTAAVTTSTTRGTGTTETGGLKLMLKKRYWEHFLMLGLMSGSGQMYIYCVGYVVQALMRADGEASSAAPSPGEVQSIQALQVAIISITNFVGRLLSGVLSDYLKRNFGYQRLWLIFLSLILMMCGNVAAMTVPEESHMWWISVIIGFAYGLTYGVYPTIISEAFGMARFSQNWGLISISQVTASYLYSFMFGRVFDSNSVPKDDGSDGSVCFKGSGCYRTSFLISFGLNCFAMVHLFHLIRTTYKRQLRKAVLES